ncbi:MAG: hypothetical protein PHY29_03035 [Syntrophales bacterium]|nr:hypothetical protein [Syntrophales bacterium]
MPTGDFPQGYNCSGCGQWVIPGTIHICSFWPSGFVMLPQKTFTKRTVTEKFEDGKLIERTIVEE